MKLVRLLLLSLLGAEAFQSPLVKSVNYHISRECNYRCKFCFHTQKNVDILTFNEAKNGIKLLKEAGMEKINFAGGEPFINDIMLGELCRKSNKLGLAVSIISNGSLIKPYWMELYGEYVDVLGVSIDSFKPEINAAIGRGGNGNNKHLDRALKVREMCEKQSITFKINTVVCALNWEEDMTDFIQQLDPQRWKCFQVLILQDENSGGPKELRDARDLTVSRRQFDSFIRRHQGFDGILVPEPNELMQNSYLLLDEKCRFLNSANGGKVPTESILDVGVEKALEKAGFDHEAFQKRGGVYNWSRKRRP